MTPKFVEFTDRVGRRVHINPFDVQSGKSNFEFPMLTDLRIRGGCSETVQGRLADVMKKLGR